MCDVIILSAVDNAGRMHINKHYVQWPLEIWPWARTMGSTTGYRCVVSSCRVSCSYPCSVSG